MTHPEALAGTTRFVLKRRLGAGGFGTVYEALDKERNSVVALKVLDQPSPDALYRFKQEFRSLTGLLHENLVTLYELLSDGTHWFFTMELLSGRSFLEHVRVQAQKGQVPFHMDLLCDALLQLCDGLLALHEAGKLHRDIKPGNILVTDEGRVVLLDFGLAAEMAPDGKDQSLAIRGTPDYMSPEQAAACPLSPASDWYSVGVLLYEALTSSLPFYGSLVHVLRQKQEHDPQPPHELLPDLPMELSTLCSDLLRRRPEDRPFGHEVRARLAALRASVPVQARSQELRLEGPELVGRSMHLEALEQAFRTARDGQPAVVLCHGGSGMGKSSLCRHFLESLRVRDRDVVILSGRCSAREDLPYKALDGILDGLSRFLRRQKDAEVEALLPRDVQLLARLFPALQQVPAVQVSPQRRISDDEHAQRAAFSALRELLQRLGDRYRVVLFIDDLQWGDLDSVSLLLDVLRPPDPPALLLCVCYPSDEAETSPAVCSLRSGLCELGAALPVRELAVGELSLEDSVLLASSMLADAARAQAIAEECSGSPLYITELCSANAAPTVDAFIVRKVAQLPEPARRLLQAVAVAGRPISRARARCAADPSGTELLDEPKALAMLRAGHLIRVRRSSAGEDLLPYHDRVRQAVVAQLSAEDLRALELRLQEQAARAEPRAPEDPQPPGLSLFWRRISRFFG